MNSVQRKKENGKLNSSRKTDNLAADPKWHKENEILEQTAELNTRLHEEITKQTYADSAVQNAIQDKVGDLKQKAVKLAKTLESEKRKNIQLEAIIRHMKYIMEQEKKVEANHRDDMNFENMDNLSRKIKKLEYDLEQMYSKNNDLNSKIRIQKNQIDAARTQRVIDSSIFLKIQKQIVFLELEYKKLLIEKTKYEKEYNKSLSNYKKIKTDIEREHTNINNRASIQKTDYMNEKQDNFFENAPEIEQAVKFTDITAITDPGKKKIVNSKRFSTLLENKIQVNQELEIKVKKVFLQTGLNDAEELIEHLSNIDKINEQLFQEVNQKTDDIVNLKKELDNSMAYRKNNKVRYYDKEPQMTKAELKYLNSIRINEEIKETDQEMKTEVEDLQNFLVFKESKEFQSFLADKNQQQPKKKAQKTDEEEQQKGLEEITEFFSHLEAKITPILFNYQELKENFTEKEPVKALRNGRMESKDETIDDLMNKIKRIEQSEKIMVRQEFKQEYQCIKKSGKPFRNGGKKKTTIIMKH